MSDIPVSTAGAVVPTRPSELVSVDAVRMSLITLLVASFAVIVLGVFRQATGGDEYIFLSAIHRAANGEPVGFLQKSYVHLFAWLPWLDITRSSRSRSGASSMPRSGQVRSRCSTGSGANC
jgi:hypothetical protein